MSVNAFPLNHETLDVLEGSLSPERLATYVAAAGGDREKAMRLYTWNTAVSAAFYGPLQGLEVAVRNAMHRHLSTVYGGGWFDTPQCGLDAGAVKRIAGVKADLTRERYPVDPPHVVAALPFGFWVSLLGRGGHMTGADAGRANYDMTLWRRALHRAFPDARRPRAEVHRPLDYLRTFRNRIAHHEPIFGRHLAADYSSILEVSGWVCPGTRDYIAHHSRVPEVLAWPRDEAGIRF